MTTARTGWSAAAVATVALLVSGCGADPGPAPSSAGPTLSVVASTDVYGDIVRQVAGDQVRITSIITDPGADPHSYEASTQNQLALSKADLVIENGGGYDDFIDTMLNAAGARATVLNVVDLSGHTAPPGGELNEHVWYDIPTVVTLAGRIVSVLSAADPAGAATFAARGAAFVTRLRQLEATEAAIRASAAGAGVAITEPVPLYLLEACGLDNRTPAAFSEAVEAGTGVAAPVLRQTLDLFTTHRVVLLAYNEQTVGPQTQVVLDAATANGIAVVPVTETLPAGKDYLTWMSDTLAAIRTALG